MPLLQETILNIARGACKTLRALGHMTAGHNGPYRDIETPVRNTAHWLITFAHAYKWTGESKYRDCVRQCGSYLTSEAARPYGFSFHHRNGNKDKCNGLIGQAWTFEALAEASKVLEDSKYTCLAEEVFFQHPFDERLGLWNRLEIDGKILPFDMTFNHQLWFAACGSLIKTSRRPTILTRIHRFLDCLQSNLTVLENGLLYHPIKHLYDAELAKQVSFGAKAKKSARNWLGALKNRQLPDRLLTEQQIRANCQKQQEYKSIGYHAFNMYSFALLKPRTPDHPFWTSHNLQGMVDYMLTDEYQQALDDNRYGYPYNPPGFEVPFALFVLGYLSRDDLVDAASLWARRQFRRCFNPATGLMDRNTDDATTLTARVYELTRLSDEILKVVELNPELISSDA